ncbi:putative nuclease HARBI1 isoform X1 [Temnothorax longispinosus]|uniref:Putative nuclease HARBI1 n=1 Tax=Temnothorax longispinosus TaxID=300112 RepID=A0A4S2KL53_9HYME|nr:Uncharacterized protein DBV15_08007 [Temnothorax longispinosus]
MIASMNNKRAINLLVHAVELIESSSSSDSEEELDALTISNLETVRRSRLPKLKNYVEEVIPRWRDKEFKSHFRISRVTFEFVLEIIAPKLRRNFPGLEMIYPEKQFLVAIWRMATPDSYRSICEKFDLSVSTALLATRRVTKILADLAPTFITWPTGNRCNDVWARFEEIRSFPQVIGAIDGTHINIPAPRVNPEAYINRKGHHSIQLQAICDHTTRFTHCYIGHAGSVHDQRVFRLSDIQDALGNAEKFPDDCHLLGDAAYKLHDNLMVPYRDNGHLTERQKNYNFCHSSTRVTIERAFGFLKNRFRCLLHQLPMNRTDLIAHFILACCVMHNICILKNDDFDFLLLNNEVDDDVPRQDAAYGVQTGVIKRDLICERLPMRYRF